MQLVIKVLMKHKLIKFVPTKFIYYIDLLLLLHAFHMSNCAMNTSYLFL